MIDRLFSNEGRKAIYTAMAAAFALAVGYGLLTMERASEVLDLLDKVFAVAVFLLARANVPTPEVEGE